MKADRTIPIIVGITGHRNIREQDRAALSAAVKAELEKLRALCPSSPVVMLCSLAEGADLLCADAAEELGIPLIAVLPTAAEEYEKDFSHAGTEHFRRHCARAEQVFVSPFTEAVPEGGPDRDYRFRQAGIYVVAHCHVLFALWDGGPGTDAACGTAEAVGFALRGDYAPAAGVSLRSESNEAVVHIFTPRGQRTGEAAGTVHILGNAEAVRSILRYTDDFNRHAGELPEDGRSRLPAAVPDDPILTRMDRLSLAAGKLSTFNAKRFRLVLALLAVASSLLTFSFLLYDTVQMIGMILACGVMLLSAWGFQSYAARSDCHRRYIEYRAVAESLRVQTFLRYAGSAVRAEELLSWTQQEEAAWIMDALCALDTGEAPKTAHDIHACWVEGQQNYHRNAGKRSLRDTHISGRVVHTALILSVVLYFAAVVFELFCGGRILPPVVHIADVEICRTVLKLSLGTISAATLFVASYYGRQSLPRTLSDHRKMERFFGKMSEQLRMRGQTEELLKVLAREELIENGNWISYERDNKPDMEV